MTRDIVIPYKKNNSGELNTCIDLIEKNVPHRALYVVEQYDRQPFSEVSHVNQILKLKWAIENYPLSEEFYLFNDDFFVLEPVNNIPIHYKSTLQAQYDATHWRPYRKAIGDTLDYLRLFSDYPPLSYELHIPFLFNKHRLYTLIKEIEPLIAKGKCPLIRSAYADFWGIGGKFANDVKNIKDFQGKTFLSTDERTFRGELGEYIRSKV